MSIREDELIEDLQSELAEYKQRAEAAEAKLRELEMQEPVGWQNCATGDMSMYRRSENERPLYAKPFPSKQEDK